MTLADQNFTETSQKLVSMTSDSQRGDRENMIAFKTTLDWSEKKKTGQNGKWTETAAKNTLILKKKGKEKKECTETRLRRTEARSS